MNGPQLAHRLGTRASRRGDARRARAIEPLRGESARQLGLLLLTGLAAIAVGVVVTSTSVRLLAYVLLGLGALAELRAFQHERTRRAAAEERSRLARELHDGVAQELVHVLGQARRMHARAPGPDSKRMLAAAERALGESRTAISTLRAPFDEPLLTALERTAGELSRRLELDVQVRGAHAVDVAPSIREAVIRIVGEALANAARHGGAHRATIELHGDDGRQSRLTVRDDGCGFDPDAHSVPSGCFGLVAMRERAAAFGGWVTIDSTPGEGTTVEVALP